MTEISALEDLLRPRLAEFGITRLADTTGLDRTGIPTASAVKPGTADVIWVYSGKGRSQPHARAVAIMECLERTCALWPWAADTVVCSAAELDDRSPWPVWAPSRFTEGQRRTAATAPIPWVNGRLVSGTGCVWLPADMVFTGHRPAHVRAASPFRVRTSNGLGAALDLDAAILHALYEVAERDIVSHYELIASHAGLSFLAAVGAQTGIDVGWLANVYRDDVSSAVTVDLRTLPPTARELVDRFSAAGLQVVVKALPNDFNLPAFGAACLEQISIAHVLGCAGYGVRGDPEEALLAALLELAQTRATDLQGAREDRHDIEKRRLPRTLNHHWLATPGEPTSYDTASAQFMRIPEEPLGHVLHAFESAGLADVAVVEFAAPDGIAAVRVLVPGVETWHCTGGEAMLGPRLSKKVNHG
ncbi:YcaO-like family protein [Dactylosporangium sp. NPDC051485]|uniref:YcaO-like family protein n=1 Tax=Dactylosporangium sp. NPDC051485 TaxID=3154846 RepID=UPI003422B140